MLKILIVDDEQGICDLIYCLIDWAGIPAKSVGMAQSGVEALQVIARKQPDVVITDICMPGIDGLKLIETCLERGYRSHFMILSGHREFDYAQRAIQLQVADYLLKPVREQELNGLLRKLAGQIAGVRGETAGDGRQKRLSEENIRSLRKTEFERLCTEAAHTPDWILFPSNGERYLFMVLRTDFMTREEMDMQAAAIMLERTSAQMLALLGGIAEEIGVHMEGYTACILIRRQSTRTSLCRALEPLRQEDFVKYRGVRMSLAIGPDCSSAAQMPQALARTKGLLNARICGGAPAILDGARMRLPIEQGMGDAEKERIQKLAEQLFRIGCKQMTGRLEQEAAALCDTPHGEYRLYSWAAHWIEQLGAYAAQFRDLDAAADRELALRDALDWSAHCQSPAQLVDCVQQVARFLYETRQQREREPVHTAKQYIEQNLGKQISLQEVAELLHFSPAYFSSYFKENTGTGFAEYVIEARIEKAMGYLRESDETVAEIAERVGYADAKHFSKVFKRTAGIKPTEYRSFYV